MKPELPPVIVHPPHPAVAGFHKDNPHPTWEEMLSFLITNFPQMEDGRLLYVIGGGVAVHLLKPIRQTPDDVDLIYRDEDMWPKFNHLPAKSAKHWLEAHRIPSNEDNISTLFNHSVQAEFNGKPVYILDQVALAFSKSVNSYVAPPRPKDLQDVELLGVSLAQIQEFAGGFTK